MSLGVFNANQSSALFSESLRGRSASNDACSKVSPHQLRAQWKSIKNKLPDHLLGEARLQGLTQNIRNALCETSPEILCSDLIGVAKSVSAFEEKELQTFAAAVLQWVVEHAPEDSLKSQASHTLRKLSGNPNSLYESAQFLAQDIGGHPVRLSLLAGMGAAGLGMRLGRLAGATWSRGLGAVGQFAAKASVGFGAELGFFSAGTRAAEALQNKSLDWSGSAIGNEILSALFLLGPMKLINPLGHLGRASGAARYIQAGGAHFVAAASGTYASAWINDQSLTGYQVLAGATHLMLEGAMASRTLATTLPGLHAAHRALDFRTNNMLKQSLSTALTRAKGIWEKPFGDNFTMGPRRAVVTGLSDRRNGGATEWSARDDIARVTGRGLSFQEGRIGSREESGFQSDAPFIRFLHASRFQELVRQATKSKSPIEAERAVRALAANLEYPRALWCLVYLAKAESVSGATKELASSSLRALDLDRISLEVSKLDCALSYDDKEDMLRYSLTEFLYELASLGHKKAQIQWSNYVEARYGSIEFSSLLDETFPLFVARLKEAALNLCEDIELPRIKFGLNRITEEELLEIFGHEGLLIRWVELVAGKKLRTIAKAATSQGRSFNIVLARVSTTSSAERRVHFIPRIEIVKDLSIEDRETKIQVRIMPLSRSFRLAIIRASGLHASNIAHAWFTGNFPRLARNTIIREVMSNNWGLEVGGRNRLTGIDRARFLAWLGTIDRGTARELLEVINTFRSKPISSLGQVSLSYYGLTGGEISSLLFLKDGETILPLDTGGRVAIKAKNRGKTPLIDALLGRYSKQEFADIFSDPEQLESKLRWWWWVRHGEAVFPLDRENGYIALTTGFDRSRTHHILPNFFSKSELRRYRGAPSKESGKLPRPYFHFHRSHHRLNVASIVLGKSEGRAASEPAMSWMRSTFPDLAGDRLARGILKQHGWKLGKKYTVSPSDEDYADFVNRVIRSGGRDLSVMLEFLGHIENVEYPNLHSGNNPVLLWGAPNDGKIMNTAISFGSTKPSGLPANARPYYRFKSQGEGVEVEEYVPENGTWNAFSGLTPRETNKSSKAGLNA